MSETEGTISKFKKLFRGKEPNIEAVFFPGKDSWKRIYDYLKNAKHVILVCMYMLTNSDVVELLKVKHKSGVLIKLIVDSSCQKQIGNRILEMAQYGIQIREDNDKKIKMHHKFVTIDGETLITGSMNYSKEGTNLNNENVLIIKDWPVVQSYKVEFNKLWEKFARSEIIPTINLIEEQIQRDSNWKENTQKGIIKRDQKYIEKAKEKQGKIQKQSEQSDKHISLLDSVQEPEEQNQSEFNQQVSAIEDHSSGNEQKSDQQYDQIIRRIEAIETIIENDKKKKEQNSWEAWLNYFNFF